jgi:hypothetical protein
MIALARFQVAGYVRSYRALYPLIVIALLMAILLQQWPATHDPRLYPGLVAGGYGDAAAFLVPIGAWASRGLLDTEPDVQRDLSWLAVRAPAVSGLLAGFAVNLALAGLLSIFPVAQTVSFGLGPGLILSGLALMVLAAVAATVFGAWTCRAVMPSAVLSILVLLGGFVLLLLLSTGPLHVVSIPVIGWDRAAHRGPSHLAAELPSLALQVLLWSTAVGAGYVAVRRTRH